MGIQEKYGNRVADGVRAASVTFFSLLRTDVYDACTIVDTAAARSSSIV